MPKKVLHIITSLSGDGAQRMLLRVCAGMNSDLIENLVVSLESGGNLATEFQKAGIRIADLGMKRGIPNPKGILKLRQIVKSFNPDIIQGWMYHGNVVASLAKLVAGSSAKVLWNLRRCLYDLKEDKVLTRIIVKLGAFLSKNVSAIIHCADLSVKQHEAIGYSAEKSVLIYNGFDLDKFKPKAEAKAQLQEILQIPSDSLIVGTVGRFHPQKDHKNFVDAAGRIVERHPNVHFVMIGRGLDSSNSELSSWIASSKLGNNIHLLSERADVPNLMAGFDIYCSSSCNEGFPNVVGEAMACGVPCVVTDAGASKELVSGIGMVVKRRDSRELSDALFTMLQNGNLPELGRLSRNRVVDCFSMASIIQQYQNLYIEIS